MKKIIVLVALIGAFAMHSCNTEAMEPQFKKVESLELVSITKDKVILKGGIVFYNPNPITVYMDNIDIDVFVEDIEVGNIVQNEVTEISKKSDFTLPLTVEFKPTILFGNNLKGLLGLLGGALQEKEISVDFIGGADFKVKGLKFAIPIEDTQIINLGNDK